MNTTHHIAIFASGSGTNAQQIINHFSKSDAVKISLVVCNKPQAFVLERAVKANIPSVLVTKEDLKSGEKLLPILIQHNIDFIVLAGFLLQIPGWLIEAFPNKIINIHPALLPKYGGKGMFGSKVHEAVIAAKESESGITIHYVNEHYDEGEIILQAKCKIESNDTADSLAAKIHQLEYKHLPETVEMLLSKN